MSNVYLEQAARGENRWWRYVLTAGAMALSALLFNIPYSVFLFVTAKRAGAEVDPTTGTISGLPAHLFAPGLLAFGAVAVALAICVRKLHRRPFRSLLGEGETFEVRRFVGAALVSFALLSAVMFAWAAADPAAMKWNGGPSLWVAALFVVLLPLQASTEELVYRGWLSQGVSRLSRHAWMPMLVSSVLFALPHLANPEVAGTSRSLAFAYFLLIGALLSWVTFRTGRLELAMGVHTGWNLCAFLVASPANTHFTPVSLFITRDAVTFVDLLIAPAVVGLTTWIVARRREQPSLATVATVS